MNPQMAASKDQEKVAEQLEAFLSPNHEEFASWYPHAAVAAARGSVPGEPGFVRLFTEGPRGAKRARGAVSSRVDRSSSAKSDSSQAR